MSELNDDEINKSLEEINKIFKDSDRNFDKKKSNQLLAELLKTSFGKDEFHKSLESVDEADKKTGMSMDEFIEHLKITDIKPVFPEALVSLNLHNDPSKCQVKLSSGESLGYVQSATVTASVGELTKATITTMMVQSDAELLQENTKVIVEIVDFDASKNGINAARSDFGLPFNSSSPLKRDYQKGTYGHYLFQHAYEEEVNRIKSS